MKPTLAEGVDPGLVHTGVVSMMFVPDVKKIYVDSTPIIGPDARAVATWLRAHRPGSWTHGPAYTFVEAYRPRSNFGSDERMVKAVHDLKVEMPRAKVLNNTGVKAVVKKDLMDLLGVWKFSTASHHQDLRSAARIMLLGMLKDDELNALVTAVVTDHLEGVTWHVVHR